MPFDGTITDKLITPCGCITVTGPEGETVPFAVRKNGFDETYESFSGRLHHTGHNYIIALSTSSLQAGRTYRIALSGTQLDIGCSDDCIECISGTANGYAVAIGAIDYNIYRKIDQLSAHAKKHNIDFNLSMLNSISFDRSEFVRYDVARLEDCSGFSFELLDENWNEIIFPVAWIKDDHGEGEEAVRFWTT